MASSPRATGLIALRRADASADAAVAPLTADPSEEAITSWADVTRNSRTFGRKSAIAATAGTMTRATAAPGSDANTSHQGGVAGVPRVATRTPASSRSAATRAITASVNPAGAGRAVVAAVASIASSATASATAWAQPAHRRA